MKISVESLENSFRVKFPYSPEAVEAIKTIPGKQFRKDQGNAWMIPKSSERALQRFLAKFSGDDVRAQIERPYVDPQTIFPSCSKTEPWPHQLAALRYMWNREAVLLDIAMRCGKTKVVIDYIINKNVAKTLIVCPKTVIPIWPEEFKTHGGMPVVCVGLDKGIAKEKLRRAQEALDEAKRRNTHAIVVLSYGALAGRQWVDEDGHTHVADQLQEWAFEADFDLLVADECQRMQAVGGKTALFLYRLASGIPVRFGLSGTPFASGPLSSYGIYRVLDPTIFGTNFSKFRERYAELEPVPGTPAMRVKRDTKGKDILKNLDELRAKVQSIRFFAGSDVIKLPPVVHTVIPVPLAPKTERLYTQLCQDLYGEVQGGFVNASNAGVLLTRLQQITSGWAPVAKEDGEQYQELLDDFDPTEEVYVPELSQSTLIDTGKQDALKEWLEDAPGEPVVVFCRFKADLAAVQNIGLTTGRMCFELSGKTNELKAWQDCTYAATLIAVQIDAGAVGIRLDKANRALYYSYTWQNGNYLQSMERLRHPSKTATCFCDHLVAQLSNGKPSVDELIRTTLGNRQEVVEAMCKSV